MAITQRSVGTWAAVNATTQTVTLPTHVAGDMLIVRAVCKPFGAAITCSTAGWAAVAAQNTNGSTANGVGVGSMAFRAFYKIAASGAETNPVVDWGTTANPGAAVAASYQKAATEVWVTPVGDGGGDATARTSQTSTIDTHVSVRSGDLVDFYRGSADDAGVLTVPTITQTSVTFDTVTESPATAIASGTGNDIAADGGYRTATAGTSSAAAVVTGTSSSSEEHGAWMTRLRVDQVITLGLIDAAPALYAPTLAFPSQTMTLPLLEGGASYSVTILTDSPTAYWRLGEPSGTVANDEIGSNDGTYNNTPTLGVAGALSGDADTAVTFTAAQSEYIDFPVSFNAAAYSLEIWFNNASLSDWGIIGQINGATLNGTMIRGVSADDLQFWVGPSATISVANIAGINTGWHHVVATYDGTNARLYLDGALIGGPTAVGTPTVSGTFLIGQYGFPSGTYANASVDEAALYGSALSAARVLAHYQAGTGAAGGGRDVYAPTLVQTAATISLGLLDSSPALYAPTITPQAVTLTLGLLDAGPALYAPTLTTVNALTLGLIDAGAAVYAPEIIPDQFVTLGLLDAGPALYAPTIAPAAVTLTLGLLDAGPTTYAPSLAVGAVTITLDLIDAGPALYAPTLAQPAGATQDITLGLLDSSPALYAPTIILAPYPITLALLDAGPALYAPTITPVSALTLGTIDAGPTTYAPTLTIVNTLTLGLLDSGPALYAPTVIPDQFVTLGLLDGGPTTYAPTIAAAAYPITVPLLESVATLYAPTVIPDQFVTLALLDAGPALYAPTLAVGETIALELLDAAPAVYAPAVIYTQGVTLGLLDAGPAVYAPSLAVGAVGVTLPLLESTPAVYTPTVAPAPWPITLGTIDAARAVYAPSLAVGPVGLTLGLIDAGATLYAPTVTPAADTVTLALLDSGPALYAPTILADQALVLGLIDSGRDLYDPTISYQQLITLDLLDSSPAVYTLVVAFAAIPLPRFSTAGVVVPPRASAGIVVPDTGQTTVIVPDRPTAEVH